MEIGSVLELEQWKSYAVSDNAEKFYLPFMGKDTSYETIFYQSGRNAIESLLLFLKEKKNVKQVLLPDYMCGTVKDATIRAGFRPEYYKIDRNYDFIPEEIEEKLSQDTCLFVAHYFGKKLNRNLLAKIMSWKKQGVIVIEDVTLSLFSSDEQEGVGFGNYTLGSIRKWLPVPDGGFIASKSGELPAQMEGNCVSKYTDFYYMVQAMKREYIQNGCKDKELKKVYMDYYALSIKELFSDYALYPMSDWTRNYLKNYDSRQIMERRCSNYDYLYQGLLKFNFLKVAVKREEGYLPFGMVVFVENRDELLKYLIENNVYCNIHWRLEDSEENTDLTYLSQHSITIPCDQRYGLEEMEYILDTIKRWKR